MNEKKENTKEDIELQESNRRRSRRRSKQNLKRPKIFEEPVCQPADKLVLDIEPVMDEPYTIEGRYSNLSRYSLRSNRDLCENELANETQNPTKSKRYINPLGIMPKESQTCNAINTNLMRLPNLEKDFLVISENNGLEIYNKIDETSVKLTDSQIPTYLKSSIINKLHEVDIKNLDNSIKTSVFPDYPIENKVMEVQNNSKENLGSISSSLKKTISLTWNNLSVTTKPKNYLKQLKNCISNKVDLEMTPEDNKIIKNVDGFAKPKSLLAIMGASGAGKTSLINSLAFRNNNKLIINGEIRLNGKLVRSFEEISSVCGYLQQEDLYYGFLTVKEHLTFQAMMRMDTNTTNEARRKRVNDVLNEFNLDKCANNVIYLFGNKGISGGERRRLALASEILTDPYLLICDEPTSGLDSFMAFSVVQNLSYLAKRGKTVVCTIHQPSSDIFEMFDNLYLVVEGRTAFFGSPLQAKEFFESVNLVLPPNYNPADYYIKNLAIQVFKEEGRKKIKEICHAYDSSNLKRNNLKEIRRINSEIYENSIFKNNLFKASFLTQMRWLLWRNIIGIIREPFNFLFQIIQTLVMSLVFGLIYLQLKYDQKGVMDMNGYIFLCLCNNGFTTIFFVVASFPLEIPVFLRENQNGTYRVISYYLSKLLIEVPIFVLLPFIFMTIAYWMGNLNNDVERFFVCVLIVILVVQCSLSFGSFLSVLAPNTIAVIFKAIAIAGPIIVPLMIFSGFLLNFDSIPNYFIWLRYLSWYSYAYENLMINQWQNKTGIECPVNSTFCYRTGQDIIDYLKVNPDNYVMNFCLLASLIVLYRILTLIAMVVKVYSYS